MLVLIAIWDQYGNFQRFPSGDEFNPISYLPYLVDKSNGWYVIIKRFSLLNRGSTNDNNFYIYEEKDPFKNYSAQTRTLSSVRGDCEKWVNSMNSQVNVLKHFRSSQTKILVLRRWKSKEENGTSYSFIQILNMSSSVYNMSTIAPDTVLLWESTLVKSAWNL